MAKFNLDDYETVDSRIGRFYFDHPTPAGKIRTVILQHDPTIIIRARVHIDGVVVADGHAEEVPGQGAVNQTSALENCETSTIGRALANAGYSPHKGQRATREEMQSVTEATARIDDLKAEAKGMVDLLVDDGPWLEWKRDNRAWHRTELGLRDAMHELGSILAVQGIEPWPTVDGDADPVVVEGVDESSSVLTLDGDDSGDGGGDTPPPSPTKATR